MLIILPEDGMTVDFDIFTGWILIDRCGKHFGTILNYLRDDTAPLPVDSRELQVNAHKIVYLCCLKFRKLSDTQLPQKLTPLGIIWA